MTITESGGRHAAPPLNGHTLAPFTIQTLGPTSALPRPPQRRRWWRDGDRIIRVLAAVVVLAVAAFAAIVSYAHIFELGRLHGQDGTAGRLLPLSVDGLIASASLVMLYAARNRITLRRLSWPRVMLWLGIGATVAANVLYGLPFGWLAAVVSAWPAVAFVGSVEMAVRFARDTRADDTPPADVTPNVTPPAVTRAKPPAPPKPPAKPPAKPRPKTTGGGGDREPSLTAMARTALALNPDLSNADLMELTGASRRQVQRARNGNTT